MPDSEDWYDIIEGGGLRQGDILLECPILRLDPSVSYPLTAEAVPATMEFHDIVILTQSCDLDQNKVSGVVCCTHFDLEEAKKTNPELRSKNAPEEIKKERRVRYTLLTAHDSAERKMGLRIVHLGISSCCPKFLSRR